MPILKTGHIELIYERGSLRWIRAGTTEIVRKVYAAVRDPNWGTIEPVILNEQIEAGQNTFRIDFDCHWYQPPISFNAHFTITGIGNTIQITMTGEALSDFFTNRTGFCVLHPVSECQGKTCKVTHPDGTFRISEFPFWIAPHQPMNNIARLEWEPYPGTKACLSFEGDIFEMEDQRNWTDASYKTYCRPLSLPFPYEIKKREKISQTIKLEIKSNRLVEPVKTGKNIPVKFEIDPNRIFKFPEVGLCISSRPEPMLPEEAAYLKKLNISHLRAEIRPGDVNWQGHYARALEESEMLNAPLFLVLYLSEDYQKELLEIENQKSGVLQRVRYVMVVGQNHLPDDIIFDAAFPRLTQIFPGAKIGCGVNAYFAELNRNRPKTTNTDFISFTVSPQVHAFDNGSLAENLEGQKYVVESASQLFPGKPVFVSPVTLKQRVNVVAIGPEPEPMPGELPPQVDPRQRTNFAAGWTAISLKYLAQAGADLVTYYETTGWRGIMQGSYPSPLPEKFPAKTGKLFPVYNLFREWRNARQVIGSVSSEPLKVDGLVFADDQIKIVLTNFTGSPQQVEFNQITSGWKIKNLCEPEVRLMDEDTVTIMPDQVLVIYPHE